MDMAFRVLLAYGCAAVMALTAGLAQAIATYAGGDPLPLPWQTVGGAIAMCMLAGLGFIGPSLIIAWVIFGKTWRS